MLYKDLAGVRPEILQAVERMGFTEMTEVQEKTIPVMMAGHDVIAKAPTGTGKTCAFGIPIIERIDPARLLPQAVILVPTRELAQQIAGDLEDLTHFLPDVRTVCVRRGGYAKAGEPPEEGLPDRGGHSRPADGPLPAQKH